MIKSVATLGVLLVALVSAIDGQSGKVSGTVSVGGKKLAFEQVFAVAYDTPIGRTVTVLFSDKPVNQKKFQEYTTLSPGQPLVSGLISGAFVTLHDDDKELSGVVLTIDAKRSPSVEMLVTGPANRVSILDFDLDFQLTSLTPRAVGRVRTKAPVGDEKVSLDLTFDAPVTALGK